MGTNVKFNILGTHPVTSLKAKEKNIRHIIIYFFSKIKTVGGRSFLTKTRTIFITIHSFAFSYNSKIKISVTFS